MDGFVMRSAIAFICIGILVSVYTLYIRMNIMDYNYLGFPLKFSEGGGMCVYGPCKASFYPLNLIIDIIILMIVSVGLTFLSYKIKKQVTL